MKISLTLLFLFLFFCFSSSAQNTTISQDTVNLRGVVIGSNGTPVPHIAVRSQQKRPNGEKIWLGTITDNDGLFTLNGLMVNDTITVDGINYGRQKYYNKGSRLMILILPSEKILDLNSENPIEVTAKRIAPKAIPSINVSTNDRPFLFVSQTPEFPGGNERFLLYVKKSLSYPDKAIKNNIEGTVEVAFTVQNDGRLNNFMVQKGIGYGCDEEVLNLLMNSPRWKPGIENGHPVSLKTSVSIKFSLADQ